VRSLFAAALAGTSLAVFADDWPQFLGPNRNGVSTETVSANWPASGPSVVWSRPVGAGFSGPVVIDTFVLLHHRQGSEEVIDCWKTPTDGPLQWRHSYPTRYRDDFGFDEGPRGTPAIAEGRVFAFGAEGTLTCLELTTGRRLWSVAAGREFGAEKGYFGFACSPLVHHGHVMLNLGGRDGAGIVAFDSSTGKLAWKATQHEAGYASPVIATLAESTLALFFTREGLVGLDPASGDVRFEFPWRSRQQASVNAATPLVVGDRVFLTASYGTGAVLLETHGDKPKALWSSDDALSSHYASVVEHEGFLYGFHGRQEYGAKLRCVEAASGKLRWSDDRLGAGSVLLAGSRLLILNDRGELCVAPATPDSFTPTARAQVLGTGARAYPALANGRLYARDTRNLICLDLRPSDRTAGPP
jgi:outer membrane protein assembly factor BamB